MNVKVKIVVKGEIVAVVVSTVYYVPIWFHQPASQYTVIGIKKTQYIVKRDRLKHVGQNMPAAGFLSIYSDTHPRHTMYSTLFHFKMMNI